jgi:hypothetical protein
MLRARTRRPSPQISRRIKVTNCHRITCLPADPLVSAAPSRCRPACRVGQTVHDSEPPAHRSRRDCRRDPPALRHRRPAGLRGRGASDAGAWRSCRAGRLRLARTLRKAPRAIARELAAAAGAIPGVERIVATPNGYLNLYLDRAAFIIPRIRQQVAAAAGAPEKTIVEHTAINPNKAAHIGHLRNAALGDTLVRALRFRGTPFETQNYIDDMGVQVPTSSSGSAAEHRTLDEVRGLPARRASTATAGISTRA